MTVPKRVALVSDWCLPRQGGIETHILQLARQLGTQGVAATIITTFPGPVEIDGIAIERIDCLRLPVIPIALSPGLVSLVRKKLETGGYDMVHIHCSIVAPLCFAALPAARGLGLPIVVTFHSVMNTMPRFLSLSDPILGWSRNTVALTAVSGLVAGQAASAFSGVDVGIVPNGFNRAFWQQPAAPSANSDPQRLRLVSALRLQPRKRALALIDIFARALGMAKQDGRTLSLTIAGDGPLRSVLERRIARFGLGDHVSLVGWQSAAQLRALYRKSDLFVMPSVRESFCIAALEARAAGLPVLAMAASGIADFVRHDGNGLLARNDSDMSQAIASLALDPARLSRLAESEDGLARYDWDNLAAEHIALYATCIERSAKPRTSAPA